MTEQTKTPLTDELEERDMRAETQGEVNKILRDALSSHRKLEAKSALLADMRSALRGLVEQVESLEGYQLTRDIEPHKAQACWDYVIDQARTALLEATEAAK